MVLCERHVLTTMHNRADIISWRIINEFNVIETDYVLIDTRFASIARRNCRFP